MTNLSNIVISMWKIYFRSVELIWKNNTNQQVMQCSFKINNFASISLAFIEEIISVLQIIAFPLIIHVFLVTLAPHTFIYIYINMLHIILAYMISYQENTNRRYSFYSNTLIFFSLAIFLFLIYIYYIHGIIYTFSWDNKSVCQTY